MTNLQVTGPSVDDIYLEFQNFPHFILAALEFHSPFLHVTLQMYFCQTFMRKLFMANTAVKRSNESSLSALVNDLPSAKNTRFWLRISHNRADLPSSFKRFINTFGNRNCSYCDRRGSHCYRRRRVGRSCCHWRPNR